MAEKELKPDFKAEYAKSNRSSCKGCSDKLEKDLVRIGKLERAANFDGEIYVWFHPRCFFNKHGSLVKDVNDIKGLADLRWDDQQTLKKFVGGGGDDDEDEDMDDDNIEGVVVEYAKSGRSTCKSCYKTIANKEVRVGEQYRDEDNGYSGTNWYHLTCFTVPDSVESVKDLDGYSKLKPADKKLVDSHFTAAFKTNSKKRKEREDDMEERAAKRQKTDDAERQRVEQLWKIKDKLKKKYNTNELKAILKFNDQSYHGGPQELIDRVADGELNGALPLCSECKKGHLYLDAGQIKCHGYLSAWSKCTFTCPPADIKERAKWKYPKDDDMDELIEKIKEDKNKDKAPGVTISHPELFNDLLFAFVGDVTNKDTLTESITQRGGQVNANVVKKVTHVISTYDEVSKVKHTTKIANAIKWDIPILSSGFINKSVEDGNINSLEDFKLWKDDKAVQVDDKYQAATASNSGPKQRKKLAIPPVDEKCSLATGGQILVEGTDVYATMLNMTDLTQGQSGRNSFYLMMIVTNAKKNKFILFRKWGRVGQEDAPTTEGEYTKGDAIAEFERIFYEKTKNTWDQFLEDTYEKKPGKFFPIELGGDEEEEVDDAKLKRAKEILQAGTTCKLDQRVQDLVKLLFDTNMFKEQMKEMKIDVKKMPLGKLSKTQLAKGVAVLEEIEQELNKDKPSSAFLLDASNRFYTVVPHDFGFDKPIPIDNKEFLQKKFDLIEILGDIEVAARMLEAEGKMGIDPITEQYNQLKNEIHPVEKDSEEWKRIQTFWDNTRENKNITIEEIYTVNRQGERELFTQHNKLDTRKLLWHGSKVAVFAAILSGGLKIMPHAGGRVGRGLYFADMISKSEQYLGLHGDIGLVLLNEVALGKIHRIQNDRPDLVKAPGANSAVLAEGSIHPDPKFDYEDKTLSPSEFPVLIPQGKVVNSGVRGSFMHNEFLVYDQTQASMRYLIKLRNKGRAGWW